MYSAGEFFRELEFPLLAQVAVAVKVAAEEKGRLTKTSSILDPRPITARVVVGEEPGLWDRVIAGFPAWHNIRGG